MRDSKYHVPLTTWHWMKARRILGVNAAQWGWLLRSKWSDRLREIGLDPESLEIRDDFRWSVALEMIYDPALERSFNIDEFRRRLATARLAKFSPETESAPTDNGRRAMLEGMGIELD